MKKISTMMVALMLATAPVGLAMAQDDGTQTVQSEDGRRGRGMRHRRGHRRGHQDPAQRAERRAEMMTAILNLDSNQSEAVREILREAAAEGRTLFEQRETARAERREAMQALRERTHERIDALLNPEQRATMDRVRAVRQERMAERREARETRRAERQARREAREGNETGNGGNRSRRAQGGTR